MNMKTGVFVCGLIAVTVSLSGLLSAEESSVEPSKVYYDSGQVRIEGFYKNGKREGPFKMYYPSGKLRSEEVYRDGKSDGLFKVYYENGKVENEGVFKDGQPVLPFKHYEKD